VFASNPQFIFHDSRGFEAGSAHELETVQAFIEKRAKMLNMADQLHAIWCACALSLLASGFMLSDCRYCLPTDNDRPLLRADAIFFDECGTGKGQ